MNNESRTEQQILWPLLPQKSNYPPLPISPILPNKHTLGRVCSFSLARYTKHLLVLWTSAAPRVTELYQEWPWDSSQLQRQNQPLAWMEDEVWGKWTSQSLAACGMPPQRAMFQKEPSHCWAESLMEAHTATARPLPASVLPERTYLGSQSNRKRDFYQSVIHFLKD